MNHWDTSDQVAVDQVHETLMMIRLGTGVVLPCERSLEELSDSDRTTDEQLLDAGQEVYDATKFWEEEMPDEFTYDGAKWHRTTARHELFEALSDCRGLPPADQARLEKIEVEVVTETEAEEV